MEQGLTDARLARDLCRDKGKTSQIWLNRLRIPAGRKPEICSGGELLAAAGCDSMYAWSYRGGLGTHEESDRPDEAWANLKRLYGELWSAH